MSVSKFRVSLILMGAFCASSCGVGGNGGSVENSFDDSFSKRLMNAFPGDGKVYSGGGSYRIYLRVDSLRMTQETEISKEVMSVVISVSSTKPKYYFDANASKPLNDSRVSRWVLSGYDGTPIYLRKHPLLRSVGVGRMLTDGVSVSYVIHEGLEGNVVELDRRVVEKLRVIELLKTGNGSE